MFKGKNMRNMGFLLAVFIIGTCFDKTTSLPLYQEEWEVWKELHNKQYSTQEEELHRKTVWEANNKFINEHNSQQDEHGYTLEMNEFGDLESSEFSSIYNGYRKSSYNGYPKSSLIVADFYKPVTNGSRALPEMLDWREKGVVTEVKNQGHCGSCWSFSATGSLEGQHALKKGKLVSLSEQQLMDCSRKYGNDGCDGGLMVQAFLYIKDNGGDDTEESYPYTAKNESCRFNPKTVGATDFGSVKVPQGDEIALMNALYNIGPISVAMDASLQSFQFYKNGVYLNYYCSNDELDHGVLAVGYGTYKGQPYWLVKNSWGTKWGIDGYFMLARFVGNMCGIATDASYPIVK